MERSVRGWISALVAASLLSACSGVVGGLHEMDGSGPGEDGASATPDATTQQDAAPVGTADSSIVIGPDGSGCPQGNQAIQNAILIPRCGACHNSGALMGGLDLVSAGVAARLDNIAAHGCTGQILVVPGDASRSYFFHKVTDAMPTCGTQMPTGGPFLPASEVTCLEQWVAAGLPETTGDAGATPDAAVWMPTPGSTPVCSGRNGSSTMCPGADCMSCHAASAGGDVPHFTAAGTVFSTATADVTAGLSGVTVRLTDAHGTVATTTTNRAGNFYVSSALTFPVMAHLVHGSTTVDMPMPVPNGGCASCHTLPSVLGTAGRVYINP